MRSILKYFVLFVSFIYLNNCSTMNLEDYKNNEPKLILEDFFSGKTVARGVFEDRFGKKWICPTTGKKFYDLNKDPVISPYSGETLSVIVTEDLEKEKTEKNNLETTVNTNKDDTSQSEEASKVNVDKIENNSVDNDEILDHDDDEILDHDDDEILDHDEDDIIDTNEEDFSVESGEVNTDNDSINELDELEEFEIDEDLDEDLTDDEFLSEDDNDSVDDVISSVKKNNDED